MSILYGASGDVRGELGNPDELEYSASDILRARTKATNLIDSYVVAAYPSQIPFSTASDVPAILNTVCDDLAVYFARRSKHPGPGPLSKDVKSNYYETSIQILEQIRDGKLEISELEATKGDEISANREDYSPIFDVDSELESRVDPDLETDISDSRG